VDGFLLTKYEVRRMPTLGRTVYWWVVESIDGGKNWRGVCKCKTRKRAQYLAELYNRQEHLTWGV